MPITFKDLENFLTVSQSKTLSEASEKLEMAQPSLSLGIKKLETEMKESLFIRSREGIKLTPQGKILLPLAEEAMRVLSQIQGEKSNIRFRIGCHASVGMFVLGDFLKLMNKRAPKIDFQIINGSSNEINKMVAQGEVDFAVVMNPLAIQGLITRFIGEDDVYVWESKDKYQDRLIMNPEMIQATSILSRWKNAPKDRIEVKNLELAASLIFSGAGVGILPSQVVKSQRLSLKRVPQTPSFKDKLALVCYPEMIRSKEGKLIFDALKESFKA